MWGVGLVASAGIALNSGLFNGRNFMQADSLALKAELGKAFGIAPDGIIGVNIMVALTDYEQLVTSAVEAGAKLIVCGAGLPMTLPALTAHAPDVALVPIVSSVRAAYLIAKKWDKSYQRLPDAVVVEDPDSAGGHLGERLENVGRGE
jgi:nitronate monooxygenase